MISDIQDKASIPDLIETRTVSEPPAAPMDMPAQILERPADAPVSLGQMLRLLVPRQWA